MGSLITAYKRKEIVASLLFLCFSIIAIYNQQWHWILIPFAWIIIPFIFQAATQRTEKLFWLLLCLLPLSTELNITPQLGLDFPDEILMIILTGLSLLYWWHKPQYFPSSVWQHPLFFLLVVHICWITISTVYAVEPIPAIKFLLAKAWYIIPFVILPAVWVNSISGVQKMAACLLWPMALVVLVTLFRHSIDGFSFESINRHLFPFFRNHVNYASMLVCLLAVLFCVYQFMPKQTVQKSGW